MGDVDGGIDADAQVFLAVDRGKEVQDIAADDGILLAFEGQLEHGFIRFGRQPVNIYVSRTVLVLDGHIFNLEPFNGEPDRAADRCRDLVGEPAAVAGGNKNGSGCIDGIVAVEDVRVILPRADEYAGLADVVEILDQGDEVFLEAHPGIVVPVGFG